jgi:hypothetical protein
MKNKSSDQYSQRESKERFEAALRGARIGAKPMKGMPKKFEDPIPENDPEALINWTKRNIQKEQS